MCDETKAWINEKDIAFSSEDCGKDLASVQLLQRKQQVRVQLLFCLSSFNGFLLTVIIMCISIHVYLLMYILRVSSAYMCVHTYVLT